MSSRDQVSERNLREIIASVEVGAIRPPDWLTGAARVMFEGIATANRSRAWGPGHVDPLADYCRVTIMWGHHFAAIERDGAITGDKLSPHFKATQALGVERLRLAKLLGLTVGQRDRLLGGSDTTGARAREIGGVLARSRDDDRDGLLS